MTLIAKDGPAEEIDYSARIAANLREILTENGEYISKGLMCVSARSLYRIADGESSPKLETLQAIVHELGIELMELFRVPKRRTH